LKLLTGQYVIAPASSIAAISDQMNNLKMLNGYLVPKTIANNADPMTVAQAALPGVTYATLKVSVQSAADVSMPTTQKSAEHGGGGGGEGEGGSKEGSGKKTNPPKKKPE
jgi:hypothetical protein